jgi:beta-glucosidase
LDEPQCFIELGHQTGYHAPGDKLRFDEVLLATHHTLLSHGKAVQAIRVEADTKPAIAMVGGACLPETESAADIAAARMAMWRPWGKSLFTNSWWSDPIFLGHYPEDGLKLFGEAAPKVQSGDMEIIAQKLDFLGLNIYHGTVYKAGPGGEPVEAVLPPGYPKTTSDC